MMADGEATSASAGIDPIVPGIPDWRGPALSRIRKLILDTDPKIVEGAKRNEGDEPDEAAFQALVRAAVAHSAD